MNKFGLCSGRVTQNPLQVDAGLVCVKIVYWSSSYSML